MGDRTGIEWIDATWNPVTGCTKATAGGDHSNAATIAASKPREIYLRQSYKQISRHARLLGYGLPNFFRLPDE